MSIAWENNPRGICEDAPCCGCCGPQGDGAYDPAERAMEASLGADEDLWGLHHLDDEDEPCCAVCGVDEPGHSLNDAETEQEFWVCDDCMTEAGGPHKIAPLKTLAYGGFITNTEGY